VGSFYVLFYFLFFSAMRISITSFSVTATMYTVEAFEPYRVVSSVSYSAAAVAHVKYDSIGV
jgi:hypothetical protein